MMRPSESINALTGLALALAHGEEWTANQVDHCDYNARHRCQQLTDMVGQMYPWAQRMDERRQAMRLERFEKLTDEFYQPF